MPALLALLLATASLQPTVPAVPAVTDTGATQPVPHAQPVEEDRWLGSDKFRHVLLSYAATAFTFAALRSAGVDREAALAGGVLAGATAGIGKEVRDLRRGREFSVRDLVADAAGVAAAFLLLREVR